MGSPQHRRRCPGTYLRRAIRSCSGRTFVNLHLGSEDLHQSACSLQHSAFRSCRSLEGRYQSRKLKTCRPPSARRNPFSCAALACARCSKNIDTGFPQPHPCPAPKTLGGGYQNGCLISSWSTRSCLAYGTEACELAWSGQQAERGVSDR